MGESLGDRPTQLSLSSRWRVAESVNGEVSVRDSRLIDVEKLDQLLQGDTVACSSMWLADFRRFARHCRA